MVVLAQAWRLTGNVCYKDELFVQIQYWRHDNPVQHGIKWASA